MLVRVVMMGARRMANGKSESNGNSAARADHGVVVGKDKTGLCRFCQGSLQAPANFCSNCGMPTDPSHDHPLYVVEALTNLFNVVFFESLMETEINRAGRYGHDISVLVAEIDSLAHLEGAYGYEEANVMVREVGEVIAAAIRDPDTMAATNRVAAFGTQRFLVLLPETGEEGAFRAAEKIRTIVESTVFQRSDGSAVVTLTVGVASGAGAAESDANLVGRATQALIEARSRGTNRVAVAGTP